MLSNRSGILIRSSVPGFRNKVYKSMGSIFVPLFDALVPRHQNIIAVLGTLGGKIVIPGSNIVTDAGDIYYAQEGAGEATTNAFGILELGTAGTPAKAADRSDFTSIASTQQAHDGTYPQTNDGDGDNTGAGTDVVTFRTSYTAASFADAAITHGWITNVTPGASEALLTGYAFSGSFEKTASDTLKVFVNHTMNGV